MREVISIGTQVFEDCSSLEKVELPSEINNIEDGTFAECNMLSNIEIPSGVEQIGNRAFLGCSSLKEIEIPSGVERIGFGAFSGCSSLKEIEIPSGVVEIGSSAFYYVPHPNIAPSLPEMALLNFAIHLPATDRYLLPMKYTGFALMVINFLRLSSSGCTQMAAFQNGLDISIGNFVPSQSNPNTVLPVPPHRFLPRSESDTPHSV